MAENLRLPVLTLVDTPGAASDAEAEAEGIGTAIGQLLAKMTRVSSPVTTLVIGEGGSGGALALCAPGNTWVTANSYFAVIAPESAAAIVNRDSSAASEVAEHLGLGPGDVVRFGVAAGVAQTT
jgi:acetyl-CoA carboxylase carboxyl transferase subunit beta